jgi:hypothetical protein
MEYSKSSILKHLNQGFFIKRILVPKWGFLEVKIPLLVLSQPKMLLQKGPWFKCFNMCSLQQTPNFIEQKTKKMHFWSKIKIRKKNFFGSHGLGIYGLQSWQNPKIRHP